MDTTATVTAQAEQAGAGTVTVQAGTGTVQAGTGTVTVQTGTGTMTGQAAVQIGQQLPTGILTG